MTQYEKKIARFLTRVLRHDPGSLDLTLDPDHWAELPILLEKLAANRKSFTEAQVLSLAQDDPQKRFELSPDRKKFRAREGHTLEAIENCAETDPPKFLYHFTNRHAMERIESEGILKMKQSHVALHQELRLAHDQGQRYQKTILLEVSAQLMHSHGFSFLRSPSGIWFTDEVPPDYLNGQATL